MTAVFFPSVDSSERPSSNTPIHYRSVHCSGEEDGLIDCPDISTATASCSHAQDAYIVCRPLSGGISRKLHQTVIVYRLHLCIFQWQLGILHSQHITYHNYLLHHISNHIPSHASTHNKIIQHTHLHGHIYSCTHCKSSTWGHSTGCRS